MSGQIAEHESAFAFKRAIAFAWSACAAVLGLGYVTEIYAALRGTFSADLHFELFRLDSEANVPSAFSAIMLFAVAVQMFTAGSRERALQRRTAQAWTILGAIFIYLGFDELFGLHEVFIYASFLPRFDAFFHFRWVILGIILVVTVATVFFPFLLRLPRITAIRLFIAGAVYVAGALGFEMIGGYISENYRERSVLYVLETLMEETLEDIGVVLAFRCVILHLAVVLPPLPASVVVLRSRLLVWVAMLGLVVLLTGGYAETNLARSGAGFLTLSPPFSLVALSIGVILGLGAWFAFALSRRPAESARPRRTGWLGIGVAALLVAVVAGTGLQAQLDLPFAALWPGQPASLRWLVLGLVLAVVLALVAQPFLASLDRPASRRFILAAIVLASGLLLGQSGIGLIVELNGGRTIIHLIVIAIAKSLQMLGAILLLRAILFERQRVLATQPPDPSSGSLSTRRTLSRLWTIVGFVILGGIVAGTLHPHGLPIRLGLNEEQSLPAWFSATLMAWVGFIGFELARLPGQANARLSGGWWRIGLLFIYLSADEALSIHEKLAGFVPASLAIGGPFHFRWLFLGIALVLLVGTSFAPFLIRLPRQTAIRLVMGGTVFLLGAVGGEMFDGQLFEWYGKDSIPYFLGTVLEESLEFVGVMLCLRALLLARDMAIAPQPAAIAAANAS